MNDQLQTESDLRNEEYEAEHPFFPRLAEWTSRTVNQYPFTTDQALIGSGCRSEQRINNNDTKEAGNCLRKLGYVTFDGFIDEKYDTLPTIHRINAIVDEIRNFQHNKDKIQHLEWMTPMLRHNLNTLKNNALFKAPNKFKKLYKLVNEL